MSVADEVATWTADTARGQLERRASDQLEPDEMEDLVSTIRDDVADMVAATLDADAELVTDGGLVDVESIGVPADEGESWGDLARRRRGETSDNWHACICGAEYRNAGAALRCCGDRFGGESA